MGSDSKDTSLSFDDDFLYYMNGSICKEKLQWDSVLEVFAFKRDLFSEDLICIGFRIDDNGLYAEIDEEMEGYKEVLSFIGTRFEGINKEWFLDVTIPAFETNLVSLWGNPLIRETWNV